jgi:hypothetical protein
MTTSEGSGAAKEGMGATAGITAFLLISYFLSYPFAASLLANSFLSVTLASRDPLISPRVYVELYRPAYHLSRSFRPYADYNHFCARRLPNYAFTSHLLP